MSIPPSVQPQRRCRTAGARRIGVVAALLLLPLLASCEGIDLRLGGPGTRFDLVSGSYDYSARSDRFGDLAWWGQLDLRVDRSGRISGSYRLPRQCTDRFRRVVDCVGRVHGRVHRDGFVTFDLDDGWLRHEGVVTRRSDVFGDWWSRLVGDRDEGRFELLLF
jgi:hypothetical protein